MEAAQAALKATQALQKRRPQIFGHIMRTPLEHPMRSACFISGTLWPATEQYVRRVGRPRKEWVKQTISECAALFGSLDAAVALAKDKGTWNKLIHQKVSGAPLAR